MHDRILNRSGGREEIMIPSLIAALLAIVASAISFFSEQDTIGGMMGDAYLILFLYGLAIIISAIGAIKGISSLSKKEKRITVSLVNIGICILILLPITVSFIPDTKDNLIIDFDYTIGIPDYFHTATPTVEISTKCMTGMKPVELERTESGNRAHGSERLFGRRAVDTLYSEKKWEDPLIFIIEFPEGTQVSEQFIAYGYRVPIDRQAASDFLSRKKDAYPYGNVKSDITFTYSHSSIRKR